MHMASTSESKKTQLRAVERLRNAGLRPTRQRLALADCLFSKGERHITAEQLHTEALANKVSVSLATVYNTLHQFTRAGLMRELVVGSSRSYFDTNTSHHHHMYDEDTGALEDVPGDSVTLTTLPPAPHGMSVSRVDVVIRVKKNQI